MGKGSDRYYRKLNKKHVKYQNRTRGGNRNSYSKGLCSIALLPAGAVVVSLVWMGVRAWKS